MTLRQNLVGLTALAAAAIAIAQQGGQAVPTIHIGAMDFTTGTLTVPATASSKPVPGFSPLWNAGGTLLVYLSKMRDSGGIRTALNVESNGSTREVASDVSLGGPMSVTLDPDIILIEGVRRNAESGVFQLDLRTGKSIMVAPHARASFVSGDGRFLYFFRGEGAHHELFEHDISTRRERLIVSYEHAPEIPESAYVSPDRTRVYYRMPAPGAKTPEPESHIVERDLASGRERTLLSGRLGHLRPSPDGRNAVVRQNDPTGKWVAMRLLPLVDDRPPVDLIRAEGNAALFFSFWSRDSRSVVLQMPDSGRPTSWWVPLYGQAPKALSRFVGSAAVHPNGKTIAFAATDK